MAPPATRRTGSPRPRGSAVRAAAWALFATGGALNVSACKTNATGTTSPSRGSLSAATPAPSGAADEARGQQWAAEAQPGSANAVLDQGSSASSLAPSTTSNSPPEIPAVPPLFDASGHVLPQTDDRPSEQSVSLQRRLELLVAAIAADDPTVARAAFFPVSAYAQVKAIAKPEQDWERRLFRAFERAIHTYHQRLGAAAANVTFAGLELNPARVKFMKPHTEGNRLSYYRALRSQLLVNRPERTRIPLEITSMISWRGEWYVVHLNGFD